MTKSDLARAIAEQKNMPLSTAEDLVNSVFEAMTTELASGGGVEIRGFGSFSLRDYAERAGRNPSTGEKVVVPAKRRPHFKAGKTLKERVL